MVCYLWRISGLLVDGGMSVRNTRVLFSCFCSVVSWILLGCAY